MFWRKRSTSKEKDYEKILADIDANIKEIEENLRQIKIREDRSIVSWLYYSIPLYSVISIGYCFYLYNSQDPWPVLFIRASPLIIGLFLIIFIKKFISIWYKKQQMKEEEKSAELKKEQKEILEELKSKLKYYETKNLIEKYEHQDIHYNNGMPMMNPRVNPYGQRMSQGQIKTQQQILARKQELMGGRSIERQKSMPAVLSNGRPVLSDMKYNQQQQLQPNNQQNQPSNPNERKWIDKLMDAIVGDVNEVDSKYALVCNFCYTHCGLALPEEYKTFKYICPNCKKLNDNAKKYNVNVPNNNNQKPVGQPLLLPPAGPNSRPGVIDTSSNNSFSKSAPVTPNYPQSSSGIPDDNNNKKPNLIRRSSTLLDEMDDSSASTSNKALNNVNQESNEENINDEINDTNQFEEEIEQEKEILNYPEENDNDNIDNVPTIDENNENVNLNEPINEEENQNNSNDSLNNNQEPVKEETNDEELEQEEKK